MYEEYFKAYRHHSPIHGADTAIFYQVGKFYEFYDLVDCKTGETQTSMKKFVDILNIRITVRKEDGPNKEDGLFAGVPEQSLHKYAALLTRAGWVVVVYDQVKDSKGAVKSRDVSRILTPGTHVEAATGEAAAAYMAGLWIQMSPWGSQEAPTFACMALDLTTGKSITYEGRTSGKRNSWTADEIFHFFQVYLPRECIVWWRGDDLERPQPETLQRQFGIPGIRIQILSGNSQGGFENSVIREEFLQKTLSVSSIFPVRHALSIEGRPCTERLLCSLLQRIKEQYPSGLNYLPRPTPWIPENNLFLGNQALFQLNMVSPQMENSVLGFFQKTFTVFGRRAMRNRILYPKAAPLELRKRYDEIQTVMEMDATSLEALQSSLRYIEDLPRLHRRISEGEITSSEILLLDKSYSASQRISEFLKESILSKGDQWTMETIRDGLASVFSIERATRASEDAFCFQGGCAPEVERIEREIQELFTALKSCVSNVQRWAGLPADSLRLEFREIQDPTIAGTRAVMAPLQEAIRSNKNPPYHGIQIQPRKSSPQVEIPFLGITFQKILQKRLELGKEIRRALPGLCLKIVEQCASAWDALEEWIATVDITATIANVSLERGFVRPEIQEAGSSFFTAKGLRHPLIEATRTRVEYVPHDVALGLDGSRGWLVYGMNASGKSSLMKAVGIAVILAQAGCYVPAASFTFAPFRSLFTRILNTDNLWAGLSSFAVEMTELREILERANEASLVLGDEVCSGTESVSATAIVAAALTHLHTRGSKFIFATHLHTLLDIPSLHELAHLSTWHLKVRYDPVADRLIYERTLTPGAGSSLYGLEVARAMNLPEEVLSLAHKLRRDLLGIKTELEASGSTWSADIQRQHCENCGTEIVRNLEVHHIRAQNEANRHGLFADGSHKDHIRNMVVLCEVCHDKVHAGTVAITPLVQTSRGPLRIASEQNSIVSSEPRRQSKWTDDQIQIIEEYLRTHPSVPPKYAVFELREKGITITIPSLRTFRKAV